ncbi:MAG: hypothetical protein ACXWCS_24730, partial [Burkholderiales bacterium]
MSKMQQISKICRQVFGVAVMLCVTVAGATAQTAGPKLSPAPAQAPPSAQTAESQGTTDAQVHGKNKSEDGDTHITPEQAKQLFSLVDQLLKFSSQESGLPIKSDVKRQMTTRGDVEHYLSEKFAEDEDAKRMQRSEIVL